MAIQQTPLYELRNDQQLLLMGIEWDDIALTVQDFGFRLDAGNRSATFTLTRLSDGAQITHQFLPGVNYVNGTTIRWSPPQTLSVALYTNPKTGQVIPLAVGWTGEIGFDGV